MKRFAALWLVIFALSFSIFAQSGTRGASGDQKKNRQPAQNSPPQNPKPADAPETSDKQSEDSAQKGVIAEDEVLKIDTDLVTIPVSVFDRDGRFVGGLAREDFEIADNNQPQKIEFFAATETPYTVALVLDTSLSAKFKINEIQTAAFQFVMNLRPNDQVVVISFDEQVRFLNEPTNDRETLRLAINKTRFGGGTSLYEAVHQTFARLKKISGRKAVVLFTDGVDTTSRNVGDGDTLAEAQEFDSLVYPVYYDTFNDVQQQTANPFPAPNPGGTGAPIPPPTQTPTIPGTSIPLPQIPNRRTDPRRPRSPNDPNAPNAPNYPNDPTASRFPRNPSDPTDPRNDPRNDPNATIGGGASAAEYRRGKQYLEKLSEYTGGRFYAADSYIGLGKAFDQINADLRSQYSLGYYPTPPGSTGERRSVKVKVNRKKVAVRARDNYVVGRKEDKPKS